MKIDGNWQHCTIEDFMNLSKTEYLAIYFCLEETSFEINQKYLKLDEPAFNLLKSKILARAEILLED